MYKIIGSDGKEYGPVTTEQLRQWLTEGRVNAQTRVQAAGTADWKSLGEFPELGGTGAYTSPPMAAKPVAPRPVVGSVPNYLVQSILCTLFCCLPLGIPGIVFAAQVNTKLAAGDVAGATESSRKAKMWCWLSFGSGLLVMVLYLVVFAAFGFRSARRF